MYKFMVIFMVSISVANGIVCEEKQKEISNNKTTFFEINPSNKCQANQFCIKEIFDATAAKSVMITTTCDNVQSKVDECLKLFTNPTLPSSPLDPLPLTTDYRCVTLSNSSQIMNQLCCCMTDDCNSTPEELTEVEQAVTTLLENVFGKNSAVAISARFAMVASALVVIVIQ